ncbi:hypothetical protein MPNT_160039 [Candidatus Methylacidithermus pantelleriae]|uniref:Uncharacterized protein n=1 Tax=Candidatus Methylacidithermus pantelleriae TaxID=2744239 RepID=A0A8J2BNN0_9BACT|nr:hypothetical protein MPNT_160039 [Candidatus Methylacidithermus pantelleriae]
MNLSPSLRTRSFLGNTYTEKVRVNIRNAFPQTLDPVRKTGTLARVLYLGIFPDPETSKNL